MKKRIIFFTFLIAGALITGCSLKQETNQTVPFPEEQNIDFDKNGKDTTDTADEDIKYEDLISSEKGKLASKDIENGILKILPYKNYMRNSGIQSVEKRDDGTYLITWSNMYVGTSITISDSDFDSIKVGSKLPKVADLTYYWGDFTCVKVEDGKKYFIESSYDSMEAAQNDDSTVIYFDDSVRDYYGNIFLCENEIGLYDAFEPQYNWDEITEPVKTIVAADAKIEYIKSIDDDSSNIEYDTVPFQRFVDEDIQSDVYDGSIRIECPVPHCWHGTGELVIEGNDKGEIIHIKDVFPAG